MPNMYFWLTLGGENIDLTRIENALQINLIDNRIEAPKAAAENNECPVFYEEIAWLLNLAEKNRHLLEDSGVDYSESQIWMIYLYEKQCNMEFDANLLERMGKLGLKFCISCDTVQQENRT